MTNHEIKQFLKKAESYGRSKGLNDQSEDFAQDAVISFVGGRKTGLKNLYIDFLRKTYGATRTPGGVARSRATRTTQSIDIGEHGLQPQYGRDDPSIGSTFVSLRQESLNILDKCLNYLERFVLTGHCNGLTAQAISGELGVTPSRVSQIMSSIKIKQKKADEVTELKQEMFYPTIKTLPIEL